MLISCFPNIVLMLEEYLFELIAMKILFMFLLLPYIYCLLISYCHINKKFDKLCRLDMCNETTSNCFGIVLGIVSRLNLCPMGLIDCVEIIYQQLRGQTSMAFSENNTKIHFHMSLLFVSSYLKPKFSKLLILSKVNTWAHQIKLKESYLLFILNGNLRHKCHVHKVEYKLCEPHCQPILNYHFIYCWWNSAGTWQNKQNKETSNSWVGNVHNFGWTLNILLLYPTILLNSWTHPKKICHKAEKMEWEGQFLGFF